MSELPSNPERSLSFEPIEIPRRSPTITARIGGKVLELTWYNSLIQVYKAPYQAMTHLEVNQGEGRIAIFSPDGGDDRNLMELQKLHWPTRLDPEPSNQVAGMYAAFQNDGLLQEINDALGGGER